jgi:tyrosyl-tRNA synthetase
MHAKNSLLDELSWRGMVYQHTDGLADALATGEVSGYVGFDPTAPSLHIGSLVPVMGLAHLQRAGHRPVALVGGGTGMIGDPSGKTSERPLASVEEIEANSRDREAAERFLDFTGLKAARMRDNAAWLRPLKAVEFMRDVGKHFTVNYMLAKDSVQSRIEGGISFTEFSIHAAAGLRFSGAQSPRRSDAADGRQRSMGKHHGRSQLIRPSKARPRTRSRCRW